ncbi:MAG: DUF1830 domain-containing protein [Cyanobacteriota bacterium]|jgi:hypothetical protein
MALPLSTSIPNGYSITADSILCSYRNSSDRMVVVRARGMSSYFLERVVFPFEVMTFYCPRDCEVEVITRTPGGLEQSEWVAAEELHAGERDVSPGGEWRPAQRLRSVHVRGNGSSICRGFL